MRFSVIAIAASFVAVAAAQAAAPIAFITAPIGDTTWTAGSPYSMTWKDVKAGAPTTEIDVTLFTGDPAKQVEVAKLGKAKYADLKFAVTIPKATKSDWYSIRLGDVWSAQFKVQGEGALPVGNPPSRNSSSTTITTLTSSTVSTATSTSTVSRNSTTSSTATATPTGNSGNLLSAGSLTAAAAAAVAAVLAL